MRTHLRPSVIIIRPRTHLRTGVIITLVPDNHYATAYTFPPSVMIMSLRTHSCQLFSLAAQSKRQIRRDQDRTCLFSKYTNHMKYEKTKNNKPGLSWAKLELSLVRVVYEV